jgi:hypothetical protein
VTALIRKVPLQSKVALVPRGCISRDDGNEERAVADLVADLLIPHIPAPQLALVEPDLDARSAKCLANLLGGVGIL